MTDQEAPVTGTGDEHDERTAELLAVVREVYDAFVAGDRDRLESQLDERCRFWDPDQPGLLDMADLRRLRRERPPSGPAPFELRISEVVAPAVAGSGDLATLIHKVTAVPTAPGGTEETMRVTSVLRRTDRWRIVVNHEQRESGGEPAATDLWSLVRRRRMVRDFTDEPVDPASVDRIVRAGLRAPSAGFSQGWDFVVLDEPAARQRFWDATTDGGEPDRWLAGVGRAPVLVICCSDPGTYLRRYAEPDKPWQDGSDEHWPVPYWDVDTGMAAMIMLLGAGAEGLGSLFFGVPVERLDAVRAALGIPDDRRLVGVLALGHAAATTPSGSTRTRTRRPVGDVVHRNRFGTPFA